MPKRNTQAEVPAGAEPKTPRAAKPRTTAAHKHASKKNEPTADAPVSSVATTQQPSLAAATREEQVRALAYSYYAARGYQGGSAEEDWFRAERELA